MILLMSGGDGIVSHSSQWMASKNPAQRKPRSVNGAVRLKCIDRVLRAGRHESTLTAQQRAEAGLVEPDEENQRSCGKIHSSFSRGFFDAGFSCFRDHARCRLRVVLESMLWYSASDSGS